MSAASEPVGAPGGGGGGGGDAEPEFEIRNDEGFVYKVPRGLYPDAAPSTTQPAAGPDPEAAGLRRRRRALLHLREKRLRDLSRWEALASEFLSPLPAPQPPSSSSDLVAAAASSSSSDPIAAAASSSDPVAAAAASSSASILDDLLVQVDLQAELMKKARQWCDEVNAECDTREAAIFDAIASLRLGHNPAELMAGLCSPAASTPAGSGVPTVELASPAASGVPTVGLCSPASSSVPLGVRKQSELMAELCSPAASGNLDGQNGRQESSGVSSEASAKKRKNNINRQKNGHDLLPPILTESRMRRVSGSSNVAPEAPNEPKRKKATGSKSTAPSTPGSTRRKANLTPRAAFILGSPGALTRRRAAAAKNESPGDS